MGNPHEQKYINMIEMVQHRATRYTLNKYNNTSSVASMWLELEWEKTCHRRSRADLICFFKVQQGLIAIPSPSLVQMPKIQLSNNYSQAPYCFTEAYKHSFFPHGIRVWNTLPAPLGITGQPWCLQGCHLQITILINTNILCLCLCNTQR